jgi:6-phosphogluconolactonase
VASEAAAEQAEVVVLADEYELAQEAAQRLTEALGAAIAQRGEAHLALTGGSSAVALYRELSQAEWRGAVDWRRVHLWWGDERFVPVDHPESNAGLAYNLLLAEAARTGESGTGAQAVDVNSGDAAGLPVPAANVHPLHVEQALSGTDAAGLVAQHYSEALRGLLPRGRGGLPAYDVILLGVGSDGHVMSVFPGSPALEPDAPLVLSLPAPEHIEPHLPRITLNPRLFEAAGLLLVMVSGLDKAEVLSEVLRGRPEPAQLPARLAARPNAVWLLDRAAASRLGS